MDLILKQLIEYFEKDIKPNPQFPVIRSLQQKLGKYDNAGYYRSTQLVVYLRITQSTYNRMVLQQFGIRLDRIHYKQTAEILIFINGKLSIAERLEEEQKYLMGF